MNQLSTTSPQEPTGIMAIIDRAARDPASDIDKLQRLLDMQEASEIRAAEKAFTAALTAAESEMDAINANARNDQTRSRYATFAALDREARPIYTKHGFGISFTTEPMGTPNSLLVVGMLSHRGGIVRRYQVPMPITTTGFKGTAMMTDTHATMAAISYGRRNLEVMMFNLQVDRDSDGNAPRPAPKPAGAAAPSRATETVDPDTGEVSEAQQHQTPGMITLRQDDTWQGWGMRFIAALRTSSNLDEIQQWQDLNKTTLDQMAREMPTSRENMRHSIESFAKGFDQ